MSDILKCFKYIRNHSSEKHVLSIVIEKRGSVPQPVGAAIVYSEGGQITETIGGGLLEHECLQIAREIVENEEVRLFDFEMNHTYSREAGPICGGRVKLLLLSNLAAQMAEINKACGYYESDVDFKVAINVDSNSMDFGWIKTLSLKESTENNQLIINIERKKKLFIAGAGHCGMAIAELGNWLGFSVQLIDPREEINRPEKGINSYIDTFTSFAKENKIDSDTAIVLVNSGHQEDSIALEACINSNAKYIGMIGSKRKIKLVKEDFISQGLATEESWQRIHAPIGININATKVKEIALSVMSEIVAIFNETSPENIKQMKL